MSAASDLLEIYRRAVVAGGAAFLGACLLPILAKWVLIGRWKPRRIPVWSLAYLRFWLVKTLVRSNPLLLVAGGRSHTSGSSSLYVLYLRALGARIGRNVAIFSRTMPVCTDLLTIGDGTVIRKDAVFPGYHAHAGAIHTGAVTLGKDVVVGELAVLDIDTSLGDGAQLGHASSLRRRAGRARRRALARLTGAAHRGGLPVGRTGPLRRRAEGHPRGDAAADRTAGVPAADDGRRGLRPRRVPTARRARHRAAGLHRPGRSTGTP